jgi:hypothetical protein
MTCEKSMCIFFGKDSEGKHLCGINSDEVKSIPDRRPICDKYKYHTWNDDSNYSYIPPTWV